MCVIVDQEDVARAIFSPKMVFRGMILPAAFELRAQMSEEYLSVMRMSFGSWKEDIHNIPQRKNRQLYGYAEMNVGEIRNICKDHVKYDVMPCDFSENILRIAWRFGFFVVYLPRHSEGYGESRPVDGWQNIEES